MYCPFCGIEAIKDSRFCANCGKQIVMSENTEESSSTLCADNGKVGIPFDVDNPVSVWRRVGLNPPLELGMYPSGIQCVTLDDDNLTKNGGYLEWIDDMIDIVLTKSALIVIASSPPSKVQNALDHVGVAGALFFVPLSILVAAYEKLYGKHNQLNHQSLEKLFEAGRAIIMLNEEAKFQYIKINGNFLFGDTGTHINLFGPIHTYADRTKGIISFSDTLSKIFEKAGFPVEKSMVTVKKFEDAVCYKKPSY